MLHRHLPRRRFATALLWFLTARERERVSSSSVFFFFFFEALCLLCALGIPLVFLVLLWSCRAQINPADHDWLVKCILDGSDPTLRLAAEDEFEEMTEEEREIVRIHSPDDEGRVTTAAAARSAQIARENSIRTIQSRRRSSGHLEQSCDLPVVHKDTRKWRGILALHKLAVEFSPPASKLKRRESRMKPPKGGGARV